MKKLSIMAAFVAVAVLGVSCTEKDPNGGNNSNYPEVNSFVETYFPQTSIQYVTSRILHNPERGLRQLESRSIFQTMF